MYMCTVTCCPTGIQDKKSLPTSSQIKHNSIATCCPTGIQEKLPHHHRSSSAAQNPQRCVLVACTRSQTIVMFLKALQDSRKKVPTLSLALYPSERAIMIGRLLIEPSFTDDERVAAPSNEGHSCGTVCPAPTICAFDCGRMSPKISLTMQDTSIQHRYATSSFPVSLRAFFKTERFYFPTLGHSPVSENKLFVFGDRCLWTCPKNP